LWSDAAVRLGPAGKADLVERVSLQNFRERDCRDELLAMRPIGPFGAMMTPTTLTGSLTSNPVFPPTVRTCRSMNGNSLSKLDVVTESVARAWGLRLVPSSTRFSNERNRSSRIQGTFVEQGGNRLSVVRSRGAVMRGHGSGSKALRTPVTTRLMLLRLRFSNSPQKSSVLGLMTSSAAYRTA